MPVSNTSQVLHRIHKNSENFALWIAAKGGTMGFFFLAFAWPSP